MAVATRRNETKLAIVHVRTQNVSDSMPLKSEEIFISLDMEDSPRAKRVRDEKIFILDSRYYFHLAYLVHIFLGTG